MVDHKQNLRYIPQLDGIRGIAILLVIAYHSMLWQLKTGVVPKYIHIVLQTTKTGWLGVDLFFVLSGFLITRILLHTKNEPWYFRSFYARRALRILPVFWVTIIAVALLYDAPGSYVACCFLFLANIGPLFGVTSIYLPFWSLCVEEHYYMLWPCIVKLLRRGLLPWICVAICIGEPLLRLCGLRWGADILFVSWYRFDGLAYGSLLALLSQNLSPRGFRIWGLGIAGSGLALLFAGLPFGILDRTTPVGASLEFTFSELFFLGFLCFSIGLSAKYAVVLSRGPLLLAGQLSYCLYLVNLVVFQQWDLFVKWSYSSILAHAGIGYYLVRVTCCVAISFLIAMLSRRFLENPILRLKRFFPASGSRTAQKRAEVAA